MPLSRSIVSMHLPGFPLFRQRGVMKALLVPALLLVIGTGAVQAAEVTAPAPAGGGVKSPAAESKAPPPPPPAEGVPVTAAVAAQIAKAMPTARATPASPRKLLVFTKTQGFRHSSINEGCEALRQIATATKAFTITFSADLADLEADKLAGYDGLVLLNTTQLKPSDQQKQALLDFVRVQGKGLIGIHAAIDNWPGWSEGQALMGGVFKNHPWKAGDTSAVKLDEPTHPMVAAFAGKGFWIKDEIYQVVGPYSRDDLRVVLSLDMSHPENNRPEKDVVRSDHDHGIAWVAQRGKGRLFYTCLGHNGALYSMPEVLQHYLDGIQFALGDLAAPTEPSSKLVIKPIPALAPAKTPVAPTAPHSAEAVK